MTAIINGDSPSITFSDATTQATSAVVSGKVPYSIWPTGSVLQVVQSSYSTAFSTSSTSFVDTGLTATITPKFSNSKILVLISQQGFAIPSGSGTQDYVTNIVRGSTNIMQTKSQITASQSTFGNFMQFLDSPTTTSATTYKTQVYVAIATSTVYFQWASTSPSVSTITLMEIAG